MKVGSIYIIKNTVNDKVYIGQTTMTVHERFMSHMKPSTLKRRRNYKLYNAVQKYGRDKFYVETLEDKVPLNVIDQKEIEYIAKYDSFNNGYNSTKGGDGRVINKIDNEDIVLHMACNGVDSKEIAKQLNVNPATVLRTLHKLGFRYRPDQSVILAMAEDGLSNLDIAFSLGCCDETVSRALNRNGARKHNVPISLRTDFNVDDLRSAYNSQMPIKDICSKFGITATTFYRLKSAYNFPTRPQIYKHKTRYHTS